MENKFEGTPKGLFSSKEHYLNFIRSWKKATKEDKQFSSVHYMIYSLLRNKDWRKCFTSVTNKNKINCNGRKPNDTVNNILSQVNLYGNKWSRWDYKSLTWPFGDTITEDMLKKLLTFLPKKIDNEK